MLKKKKFRHQAQAMNFPLNALRIIHFSSCMMLTCTDLNSVPYSRLAAVLRKSGLYAYNGTIFYYVILYIYLQLNICSYYYEKHNICYVILYYMYTYVPIYSIYTDSNNQR